MVGLIKQSKFFLRFMTICGLTIGCLSFNINCISYIKVSFWNEFELGQAPLLIGLFAISGFQILFLGLFGEYLNLTLMRQKCSVVKKENSLIWDPLNDKLIEVNKILST